MSLGVAASSLKLPFPPLRLKTSRSSPAIRLNSSPSPAIRCDSSLTDGEERGLRIGSPVIVVEAPATLKTAGSMPSLRINLGLVKPGDVGRIISRKPKDVWAVRLAIGSYLLDGKHFKPLNLNEP